MSRYPWRDTSADIAEQSDSQWETPASSQEKANKALSDSKEYTDEHIKNTIVHLNSTEHEKLTNIEDHAQINQNAFSQINDIIASSENDSLNLIEGVGIAISSNPLSKNIRITNVGTSIPGLHGTEHVEFGADPIPNASETEGGLMSANDKKELSKLSSDISNLAGMGRTTETVVQNANNISDLKSLEKTSRRIANYTFGYEYLVYYHTKVMMQQDAIAIFSGDSTSNDGPWITNKSYLLHNVARTILDRRGANRVVTVASGHSGARTPQWQNEYLASDLAQSPDLYVLRWGLNDAAHTPSSERLQVFTDALRGGLATLRASKNVNQLSIVLMMPNSTNDPVNGRDSTWFDLIRPVIMQAARDYQCCFVDTYSYLLDSTNVVWQDDMANDGVHIHPTDIGNAWIVGLLTDILVPKALQNFGISNPLSTTKIRGVAELPTTYPSGVSMYRTDATWPYDGLVYTINIADGILLQYNNGLFAQAKEAIAMRRGLAVFGVPGAIGDNAWGEWIYLYATESPIALTLENGVTLFDNYGTPSYALTSSGHAELSGVCTIPSGFPSNGVIATLPTSRRPEQNGIYMVATSSGYSKVSVWADGTIRVLGSATAGFLSLDGITLVSSPTP